jgi:two-component system cell cycle response regulator PopA
LIFEARLLFLCREDDGLEPIAENLDRLGLRTLEAHSLDAAMAALSDLPIEAVLVAESCQNDASDIVAQLRAACWPRRVPVIMIRHDDAYAIPAGWDMVFTKDAHPQQILLCIEHMIRACVAEEEYDTRRDTFKADLSGLDKVMQDQPPLSILSIGQPDPEFLALTNDLTRQGVEVIGALSSYSGFDYLHDKTFDAVVLWSGQQPSEALSIAAGMRRNTRLYHTPVLLRLNTLVELDIGDAYLRGVNDIANPKASVAEISDRLMRLARIHRRQLTIRKTLESMRHHAEMDMGTGLFGRDLFAAHLARLSMAATERSRPLSICVLKIAETSEVVRARQRGMLERAVPQIGSMIARLVRAEDTGGRLSNEVFALAMPATSEAAARSVGERISAVVSCTAFESGQGKPPFVVEFDIGVAQIMDGEAVASALTRAALNANRHSQAAV